jgi:hypothetical protein
MVTTIQRGDSLSWEADSSLTEEISFCLWWKPKIQFPCHETLLQILSWAVWVQSTVFHFISLSCVVILFLYLCLDLLSDPFPSGFRLMYFLSLPLLARFTSPWFYHLKGIIWVKIMKLLNMKFSPSLWYILPHKYTAAFWSHSSPFHYWCCSQLKCGLLLSSWSQN